MQIIQTLPLGSQISLYVLLALMGLFREMEFVAMTLVVTHTHHYGMARQLEVYAEEVGYSIRVFRTRAEAEAWIDAANSAVA